MLTYISRKEHEAAGDYSGPVVIRGHYYRVDVAPVFEDLRDTATVEAEMMIEPVDKLQLSPGRDR